MPIVGSFEVVELSVILQMPLQLEGWGEAVGVGEEFGFGLCTLFYNGADTFLCVRSS